MDRGNVACFFCADFETRQLGAEGIAVDGAFEFVLDFRFGDVIASRRIEDESPDDGGVSRRHLPSKRGSDPR